MSGQPDIDIRENYIKCLDTELLSVLLKDRSSGKNIIWATDIYASKGASYDSWEPITVKLITGRFGKIIRPRIDKSQKEQKIRIKDKAEVFTPSWICNEMNNHLCDEWFEKKDVFNTAKDKTWIVNNNKIPFTNEKDKTWQDFVKLKVLEISCGEAPFLASRYDTTTGEWIDVNNRIGALDRKLRVINENCNSEQDWYHCTLVAFKSTFGYEWQGDSLLIARENLLFTFIDYYIAKFGMFPIKEYLIEIAKILSWNIWQMDGLKDVIPNSCKPVQKRQMSLFEDEGTEPCLGCAKNDNSKHTGIYSRIMNWETKRSIKFFKGEKRMKFDFVIGNPPYQVMDGGAQASATPVYNLFVEEGEKITSISLSFIMPSRWMTGGKGLDEFRQKMIRDRHIILMHDYADAQECFSGVSIKGGVCYFVWNRNKNQKCEIHRHDIDGETISLRYLVDGNDDIYIRQNELVSIKSKVWASPNTESFIDKVSSRKPYGFCGDVFNNEEKYGLPKMLSSKPNSGEYYKIIGLDKNKRVWRFLPTDYPFPKRDGLDKYKIFAPRNYGCGEIGEIPATPVLATPVLATPEEACTETFIQIGPFDDEYEMKNCYKYYCSKFFRVMVGIAKQDQGAASRVYRYVPLQDFTDKSDIDWSKSIHEIDLQLYKKYGLDQNEINFIESHVKEMK